MASQRQVDNQIKDRYLEKLRLIAQSGHINPFESDHDRELRIDRARRDIAYCVQYYFPHYCSSPSAAFQQQLARRIKKDPTLKALVRWGRGLAKSVWCDIFIPFWLHLNGEDVYLVLIGNNERKGQQLLSDLQAEFEANPAILHDFGEQITQGSWEDGYFITRSGFIGQALGMGQSPRGLRYKNRRPTLCVCDDLDDKDIVKNPRRIDEAATWIEQDLVPTMDGPVRRLLVPNNRYAPKTIQSTLQERHPGWLLHEVAAYDTDFLPAWPQKYPRDYYVQLEREIGRLAAQAEYNNRPHVAGKIFKDDQIQWVQLPRLNQFKHIIGHWDVAYSGNNDYNAVKVWGTYERNFYHIKAFCRQCKMKAAIEWMMDYEESLPDTVKVHWQFESQFWNETVLQTIQEVEKAYGRSLSIIRVEVPKYKKYDRIITLQPLYQNSRVYYNIKERGNNDMLEGINQLKGIEPGYNTHDDGPDADQQAIDRLMRFVKSDGFVPELGYDRRPYEVL
ncbi:MAG TPA: hypothetical protein P5531_10620 [Bacteroidales bacterium]|nr:hypothetical protein [Bacteroidales bacterium]HSA43585.1 hypothetical protein [Bacteroidales bacterium]